MYNKTFEIRLTHTKVMSKSILNKDIFIEKKQGRGVIISRKILKILIIYPNCSKFNIKCHKRLTRDQNFWFKSTIIVMLPELKVHDHELSPLPMQNPYSKLSFCTKANFVNRFLFIYLFFFFFAAHIMTNLVPTIVENIFCLPPN